MGSVSMGVPPPWVISNITDDPVLPALVGRSQEQGLSVANNSGCVDAHEGLRISQEGYGKKCLGLLTPVLDMHQILVYMTFLCKEYVYRV